MMYKMKGEFYLGVYPRDEEPHDEQAEQRAVGNSRQTRLDLQLQTVLVNRVHFTDITPCLLKQQKTAERGIRI